MRIRLEHGDGGSLTHELVASVFRPAFRDRLLDEAGDAAILPAEPGEVAISTDAFVVQPLEFPGGDIGTLAVSGTVNDLAVSGATPQYLVAAFILEEGLDLGLLRRVVDSMACTARDAGVRIVAGDTKVVEKGKGDGLYITTTGVGRARWPGRLGMSAIQPDDRVIINGGLAEHAVAVLCERARIRFAAPLESDCRPLNRLIAAALDRFRTIRFMRDPTRGGLATTLKEVALATGLNFEIDERRLPLRPEVGGALELLGMDPLYMANEGKVLMVVSPAEAADLVSWLRQYPGQEMAADIGRVVANTSGVSGSVRLRTPYGGTRNLEMRTGAPLPRIC